MSNKKISVALCRIKWVKNSANFPGQEFKKIYLFPSEIAALCFCTPFFLGRYLMSFCTLYFIVGTKQVQNRSDIYRHRHMVSYMLQCRWRTLYKCQTLMPRDILKLLFASCVIWISKSLFSCISHMLFVFTQKFREVFLKVCFENSPKLIQMFL